MTDYRHFRSVIVHPVAFVFNALRKLSGKSKETKLEFEDGELLPQRNRALEQQAKDLTNQMIGQKSKKIACNKSKSRIFLK